jgi:membrane protein implicated in regulation of membrane protease activity
LVFWCFVGGVLLVVFFGVPSFHMLSKLGRFVLFACLICFNWSFLLVHFVAIGLPTSVEWVRKNQESGRVHYVT